MAAAMTAQERLRGDLHAFRFQSWIESIPDTSGIVCLGIGPFPLLTASRLFKPLEAGFISILGTQAAKLSAHIASKLLNLGSV
ncbi:MAG: hypothetical protein MUF25_12750 [Pirellulaceae bacterium]|nr:hypothetical protein [Pirellulaceae bacterium]